MAEHWYLKWEVPRWMADTKRLTPLARGVLFDWLCEMHQMDRTFELSGTVEELARFSPNSTVPEIELVLAELERTKVAEIARSQHIVHVVSRRFRREFNERKRSKDSKIRARADARPGNVPKKSHDTVISNKSVVSSKSPPSPPKGEVEIETLLPLTSALRTDRFSDAWSQWARHRAEQRKKLTPTSVKQQLAKLEEMGHDRAIAAIEFSIANGYQGIFEPSSNGRAAAKPSIRAEQIVESRGLPVWGG